jgi:hypothetical protein
VDAVNLTTSSGQIVVEPELFDIEIKPGGKTTAGPDIEMEKPQELADSLATKI